MSVTRFRKELKIVISTILFAENHEIFQLLSRKDLADFAATSTKSAVKLPKSFEKDGLIALEEKDIEILDCDFLVSISKHG